MVNSSNNRICCRMVMCRHLHLLVLLRISNISNRWGMVSNSNSSIHSNSRDRDKVILGLDLVLGSEGCEILLFSRGEWV
jgi:hypothetical protein